MSLITDREDIFLICLLIPELRIALLSFHHLMSTSSPTSNTRRQSYDFGRPDEGLAEWTTKVRSMQSLVDEDEAKEQRRLEEEITRSRLERAKRRTSGNFGACTNTITGPCEENGFETGLN